MLIADILIIDGLRIFVHSEIFMNITEETEIRFTH